MIDSEFTCWLAGFFDGEGSIHLPIRGIDVSIANTDKAVIEFIQSRLCCGTVTVISYDKSEWKTKYHWRLRNFAQAFELLSRLRPYLKIKGAKADEAIRRCISYLEKRKETAERNRQIIELVRSGLTCKKVSHMFGLARNGSTVSMIVHGVIGDGERPQKVIDIRRWRKAHERTTSKGSKNLAVHTRSEPLK